MLRHGQPNSAGTACRLRGMGKVGWVQGRVARLLPPQVKGALMTPQRKRYLAYTDLHGRPPWLPGMKPRTFSGKTLWRMMYDRRERLKLLNDKLAVKDIAAEHGIATPRTLWYGTDPAELAAASHGFERRWVLKPNHGSQVVRFFEEAISEAVARETTAGWLEQDISDIYGEWHTQFARRLIVAEESLIPRGVDLPDYKFFVFEGRPVAIQVSTHRMSGLNMTFYKLPEWQPLNVTRSDGHPRGGFTDPPPELPEMLGVASRLGADWDFLRVDLYALDGQVWLGELTGTPSGAQATFDPRSFDRWLGGHWRLPSGVRADSSVVL